MHSDSGPHLGGTFAAGPPEYGCSWKNYIFVHRLLVSQLEMARKKGH